MPPAGGPRVSGAHPVRLTPGSRVASIMGATSIEERFSCSYGLNPAYQPLFEGSALAITGTGPDGEARVVERAGHPFFIGTLFLPQLREPEEPLHPLIRAFVDAAAH